MANKQIEQIEKNWNEGERIYDSFASQFGFKYSTPSTYTLGIISILSRKKEKELLLRIMLEEYISNLSDEKIVLKNNKLYSVSDKLTIK